jgi:hypothetical protein
MERLDRHALTRAEQVRRDDALVATEHAAQGTRSPEDAPDEEPTPATTDDASAERETAGDDER